jgi:hypothetical protein
MDEGELRVEQSQTSVLETNASYYGSIFLMGFVWVRWLLSLVSRSSLAIINSTGVTNFESQGFLHYSAR